MSSLPSLAGRVTPKGPGAKIIPLNSGLAGVVAKAQREDLKTRRDYATGDTAKHTKFHDISDALVDYLHTAMRDATSFKQTTGQQDRLRKNIDLLEGRYTAQEYKLIGGKEPALWYHLTERVVRTFVAFLRKTLAGVEVDFPQYDLQPTAIPDPPPEMINRARDAVLDFVQLNIAQGIEIPPEQIDTILSELADTMFENVKAETQKSLKRAKREVDDALQTMDWAGIIDELLHDLVLHGTAICHGPYVSVKKRQYYTEDEIKVQPERFIAAGRVDPLRFYPSRDSKTTQDGSYLIWHDTITRTMIEEARGLTGDGWIDEALCTVLLEFNNKSRYWCASTYFNGFTAQSEESVNNPATPQTTWAPHEEIDILKYYGKISGKLLLDHKIDNFDGRKVDEKYSYEGEIFWIGDTIVRVKCSTDPLCERPFQKAVLFDSPGRFWGRGAAEAIEPQQRAANGFFRGMMRNAGFASAPIFEFDRAMTRPVSGEGKTYAEQIYPGKIIEKNSRITGLTGQVLHTHQIEARIAEFSAGIRNQEEIAEHILGLPKFLTGNHSGGGAARTFSGLQQLTENAAVQIRSSIINLDFHLIKPFIRRVHRWVVLDRDDPLLYSDVEVITQGASALLAREVHKDRLTALIGLLMPFAQAGMVTPQGVSYILAEVIRDHGLDPDLVMADNLELSRYADVFRNNLAGQQFNGGLAAAGAPTGTVSQAGGGAPQLDPFAAQAALGQTIQAPIQAPIQGGTPVLSFAA